MSAARYDLVIDQGSDFAVEFTVAEAGVVKNLTGYSARAQLRPSKGSSELSATFTATIPTLGNAASSSLTAGRFFYDLEIFSSNNLVVSRLLFGEVTLTQEVTR